MGGVQKLVFYSLAQAHAGSCECSRIVTPLHVSKSTEDSKAAKASRPLLCRLLVAGEKARALSECMLSRTRNRIEDHPTDWDMYKG